MSRYPEQQPMQFVGEKQGSLTWQVRKWLAENDRTRIAGYAPGYVGDNRPTHRGIIGHGGSMQ